jgi:hypothetical protein
MVSPFCNNHCFNNMSPQIIKFSQALPPLDPRPDKQKDPNQILDLIRAFDYLSLASHSLTGLNIRRYEAGHIENVAK